MFVSHVVVATVVGMVFAVVVIAAAALINYVYVVVVLFTAVSIAVIFVAHGVKLLYFFKELRNWTKGFVRG